MKSIDLQDRYSKPKRGGGAPVILGGLVLVALIILGSFMLIRRSKAQEQQLFAQAEAFYVAGQYEQATTAFHDFLSRYDNGPHTSKASYLLAMSQQALGEYEATIPLWRKLLQDPSMTEAQRQRIQYNLATALEHTGQQQEAAAMYEKSAKGEDAQLAAASWLRIGEYREIARDLDGAAEAYREAAENFPATTEGQDAVSRLNELILPQVLKQNAEPYQVQRGDVLATIARKMGSTVGQITLANGLKSTRLRVGDRLLVPKVEFNLDVGLEDRTTLLKVGDQIVKSYPMAIGAPDTPTPEGNFRVINKLDRPDWRNPDGLLIPYGAPENELGARWIGFANDEIPASRGFGLHGTIEPDSIGKDVSHGCLRYYNEDIRELFSLLRIGTPIRVGKHTQPAQWYRW